jgi:hypothetical protein
LLAYLTAVDDESNLEAGDEPPPRQSRVVTPVRVLAVVVIALLLAACSDSSDGDSSGSDSSDPDTHESVLQAAMDELDAVACPESGLPMEADRCVRQTTRPILDLQSQTLVAPPLDVSRGVELLSMGFREGGGVMLVMGRDGDGDWYPWFTGQNLPSPLLQLPGEVRICPLNGGVVNLRSSPDESAEVVTDLAPGEVLHAESFQLTRAEDTESRVRGEGWYEITAPEEGWVYSRETSNAHFPDCAFHDALEPG